MTSENPDLHPGVFLEEVDAGVHPIDGVPTSTTGRRLSTTLVLVAAVAVGGWWWRRRRA